MSQLPMSAYGTNITPPAPISYNLAPIGQNNIAGLISSSQTAQNEANAANQQRYTQQLGVLGNAASGQQGLYGQALNTLNQGYGQAQGALSGAIANNQTVFGNEQQNLGLQTQQAMGAADQSAVSRGLGNTTVMNSMQTQVQNAANQANMGINAALAQANNSVYNNQANLYAAQGGQGANLTAQQGNAYAQGGDTIANAISARNDTAPSVQQTAALVQQAQAAIAGSKPTTITTQGGTYNAANAGRGNATAPTGSAGNYGNPNGVATGGSGANQGINAGGGGMSTSTGTGFPGGAISGGISGAIGNNPTPSTAGSSFYGANGSFASSNPAIGQATIAPQISTPMNQITGDSSGTGAGGGYDQSQPGWYGGVYYPNGMAGWMAAGAPQQQA